MLTKSYESRSKSAVAAWRIVLLTLWWTINFRLAADAATAEQVETTRVVGLQSPVEIFIDPWGIAHIYAQTEHDLFLAQGYYAARTRLFQLEMWRRLATGTMAEIVGARAVDRDIGARLLRFRGDLQKELAHYHPRGAEIITAFVHGVNAWIEATRRDPALLPLEFRLLEFQPGFWTPEVVVSRHHGLTYNATQELNLGRAVARVGSAKVKELVWFHPGEPALELDHSLDGSLLSADILKLYRAARAPIDFRPADVAPPYRAAAMDIQRPSMGVAQGVVPWPATNDADWGSNNWVISGRLTVSGLPILANDPHRALQVPSLRYFVHLVGPGWNVIGGGEPAVPGVSIGHNESGAWGLTVFSIDTEDLYVYQTHPDNPNSYRYGDGWQEMTVLRETIMVKDRPPVEVDLKFTRHGPVLYEDTGNHVAVALRAAWLEVGGAPYLASLRMDQAASWDDFRHACRYSYIPGENMVWADRLGNIGWQVAGIAPLRTGWDGLLPVPGDGRYEWQGFLPGNELPQVLNPLKGFWNTSNENLIPLDYAHRRALGWTWADPYRGARVHEVLASGRKFALPDMTLLQHDELSLPARTLVPMLLAVSSHVTNQDDTLRTALDQLRQWDYVLDHRSVAAGIYIQWQRKLLDQVRVRTVPQEVRDWIGPLLSMKRVIDWLTAPDGRWGDNPVAGRDAVLWNSFREAIAELTQKFGPEIAHWRYGQPGYKHVRLRHPLSTAVSEPWRERLDCGPLPRGGDAYTVNNTGGGDNQTSGATFRVIIDVSDWDLALATNAPGQSGNPDDPHYRDLFEMWAAGRYFPLLYSRQKIETVSRQRITLVPHGTDN